MMSKIHIDKTMLIGCVVMWFFAMLALTAIGSTFLWFKAGYSLGDVQWNFLWIMEPSLRTAFGDTYTNVRNLVLGLSFGVVAVILVFSLRPVSKEYGDSHWQTKRELEKNGNFGMIGAEIILGKVTPPKDGGRDYITTSKLQPHCHMMAPTGSGKTISFVIPNLILFAGSAIVLDVKGDLWEKTAHVRAARGSEVFRFDPKNNEGITHCFNPMIEISKIKRMQVRYTELERLAQYMLAAVDGQLESWMGSARRLFIAGALLAIDQGNPSVGAVLRILQISGDRANTLRNMAAEVKSNTAKHIFAEFAGYDDTQWSNYTSVLFGAGGLGAWSNETLDMATRESDFTFTDFRSKKQTMYICVDQNDLKTMAPLVRMLFGHMMATLMRKEPDPQTEPLPVMLMIDEFTQLGKMDVVASSIDVLRSFGGRVMLISQNLPRLDVLYTANGRNALLAGAGAKVYLTPNETETGEHISKYCGKRTKDRTSRSRKGAGDIFTPTQTRSESHEAAPLISLDDVMRFDKNKCITLMNGQHPIKSYLNKWFEDPLFMRLMATPKNPKLNPKSMFDRFEVPLKAKAQKGSEVVRRGDDVTSPADAINAAKVVPPLEEEALSQENIEDAVTLFDDVASKLATIGKASGPSF